MLSIITVIMCVKPFFPEFELVMDTCLHNKQLLYG